jgi:hypothetical protein
MTIGKSGHKFGPPGPYLVVRAAVAAHGAATTDQQRTAFKDFVEGFCTPTVSSATSPAAIQHFETESVKGYTMEQVVARLNEKAEAETRTRLAMEIQVFRFKVARATRSIRTSSSPHAARTRRSRISCRRSSTS